MVGNNNNFSYAAALAVAQAPGKSYNPLFLYGGVGLGKTHLLHAIGQHVATHKKGARVAYVSSEKFTNEYIDGIQNNQLARFRKSYRQTDVLLIDDIQFLAGKERIQEEFFHTFNALHEGHKQIVLTCDRPASEIQNLEHRLMSRFEWGLVTDLQPPDVEMRLAILQKKAQIMGVQLPEEIMQFLANRIRNNIRRLEGALIRVASYAALTGKKLSLEVVEGLLREVLNEEGRYAINIEVIQKTSGRALRYSPGGHDEPAPAGEHCLPAPGRHVPLAPDDGNLVERYRRRLSVAATTGPCCMPAGWSKTAWKWMPMSGRSSATWKSSSCADRPGAESSARGCEHSRVGHPTGPAPRKAQHIS